MNAQENELQRQIKMLELKIVVLQERVKVLETKTEDSGTKRYSPLEADYKLVKNWADEHNVRKVRVCNWRGSLVVEDITGDFMNADDIYISKNAVSQNTVEKYSLPVGELLREIKDRTNYEF